MTRDTRGHELFQAGFGLVGNTVSVVIVLYAFANSAPLLSYALATFFVFAGLTYTADGIRAARPNRAGE